jgi:predicted membrane protein (TIGR00267 family)
MNETRIDRASRFTGVTVALVDGLPPFLTAIIVLTPFFVAGNFETITLVYYTSLGLALLVLFSPGLFLGRVSRGNLFVYGLKTILGGVVSIVISFLLRVDA